MHKWVARLAFSFVVLAAVLAWSGRQAAQRGDSATLYYAAAALLGAAGIVGLRERHRR
jgi:MYXO-CTERM domain-containing protein